MFIPPVAFARMWGASETTIRYWIWRGWIPLHEGERVDVHEGDLAWGLGYWDQAQWPTDLDAAELRVFMTIEMQAIERELIRLGYLPPEDRVERRLECLVRSPEWWRRNRAKPNGSDPAIKSAAKG